jgi:hypothetical protein
MAILGLREQEARGVWCPLLGLLLVLGVAPAEAWQRRLAGTGGAGPLALDGQGNPMAAVASGGRMKSRFGVVKLARRSGREHWCWKAPNVDGAIRALAPTAGGDAVVAGEVYEGAARFLVVRLAGDDGRLRWRADLDRPDRPNDYETAQAIAVGPTGDVIAGTLFDGPRGRPRGFVAALPRRR